MAERRMFAKSVCLSDTFLDMPLSARCLYFTFGLYGDDDGFVQSPKALMRECGASNDDLAILLTKRFVLAFESGVIVIKDWRINNYLRNDRYTPTKCVEEMKQLEVADNGTYEYVGIPPGIPPGIPKCQNGIPPGIPPGIPKPDNNSNIYNNINNNKDYINNNSVIISAENKKTKRFIAPTQQEVAAYCSEKGYKIDAQHFVDYYEARGWTIGKSAIKDWKACVRTWVRNDTARTVTTTTRDESDEVF